MTPLFKRRLEVDNENDNSDSVAYLSKFTPGMRVTLRDYPDFKGKIVCLSFWEFGCVRIGIRPLQLKDGATPDAIYVDEPEVILLEEEKEEEAPKKRHGPRQDELCRRNGERR